jgi:hypothetical protein
VAVRDYLAVGLAPPGATANTRVYACHPGWCRFRVTGTSDCSGTVQIRSDPKNWHIWFSSLRCR